MKKSILILMLLISVIGVKAQKTAHGDCRVHIEAYYSHGNYYVAITNKTTQCESYKIRFPDGFILTPNLQIPGGATYYIGYASLFLHGAVIVTPFNMAPANCGFGSVQVNL